MQALLLDATTFQVLLEDTNGQAKAAQAYIDGVYNPDTKIMT
jgi:hypothetical protein